MKTVLVLIHRLQPYRVAIFNRLAERVQLTVACENFSEFASKELAFETRPVTLVKKGPFLVHKNENVHRLASRFDVVIGLFNLRCIDIISMLFRKRGYRLLLWGIGVSGSYTNQFDQPSLMTHLRIALGHKADGLIFYTDHASSRFRSAGHDPKKLFVAPNTIDNLVCSKSPNCDKFVFIGTLYKKKGVDQLIEQYIRAFEQTNGRIHCLHIIGDGPEREAIKNAIPPALFDKKVFLHGAIYDQQVVNALLSSAVLAFSPRQAGLAVLHCMSCGVPFVTLKNAITGGEIMNIESGVNGILLDCESQIAATMVDAMQNPRVYLNMGTAAQRYYLVHRSPEQMVHGLLAAIG